MWWQCSESKKKKNMMCVPGRDLFGYSGLPTANGKKKEILFVWKEKWDEQQKKKNGRRVSLDLCHRVLQSFFLHGVPDINSLSMNPPPPQKKKQVKRNTFVCLEDALIARSRMPTLWGLSLKWSVSRRSLWKWPSKRKKILTKKEGGGD